MVNLMMRPKHLAIELSKLIPHPCSNVELEQYATEGDLAAYWMLGVNQLDDVGGKHVLDLCAGNGILGLGCLLIGAKRVTMVEADPLAAEVARKNCHNLKSKFDAPTTVIEAFVGTDDIDVSDVDIIVMNPPWGVQSKRADRVILQYAFAQDVEAIHVLHSAKATHLESLAKDNGWEVEGILESKFRLPPTYSHHSKGKAFTDIICWRFYRSGNSKIPIEEIDELE